MHPQIQSFSDVFKRWQENLMTEEQIHDLYGSDVLERIKSVAQDEYYNQAYV